MLPVCGKYQDWLLPDPAELHGFEFLNVQKGQKLNFVSSGAIKFPSFQRDKTSNKRTVIVLVLCSSIVHVVFVHVQGGFKYASIHKRPSTCKKMCEVVYLFDIL